MRLHLWLWLMFAACSALSAQPEAPASAQEQPAAAQGATTPAGEAKEPGTAQAEPFTSAHIALLLPLRSKAYKRAAQAVADGFMAAAAQRPEQERLPIRVYSADGGQDLLQTYAQAATHGARLVVGPLTREDVTALVKAGRIVVPTLALNSVEGLVIPPGQFYTLALSLESEARQAAWLGLRAGKCQAVAIYVEKPLERRLVNAFTDEWGKGKCNLLGEYKFQAEEKLLRAMREELAAQPVDAFFLAGDAAMVRRVRYYLKPGASVYATSQVNRGKLEPALARELKGVQFLDMPWLLQPDHPAVAVYPQPKLGIELQRFYALGLDAYRVAHDLLNSETPGKETLDGVTGRISLSGDFAFEREGVPATFLESGDVVPLSLAK